MASAKGAAAVAVGTAEEAEEEEDVHVRVIGSFHLLEDGGGSLLRRVSLFGLRNRLFSFRAFNWSHGSHVTNAFLIAVAVNRAAALLLKALGTYLELQAPCMTQGAPM